MFGQLERRLEPYGLLPMMPVRRRTFSLVFPARQLATGRELFVKLLLSDKPGLRRSFSREIEILTVLAGQPGVAPLVAASTEDLVFHACDRVCGRSLGEIAQASEGRDLALLLKHGRALAEWIADLHRLGIAHRDLSPDHVFVEADNGWWSSISAWPSGPADLPAAERPALRGLRPAGPRMILWEMIRRSTIFAYRDRALPAALQREAALVEGAGLPPEVRRGCCSAASPRRRSSRLTARASPPSARRSRRSPLSASFLRR
jgi:serine/threonine protein kinase